MSRETPVGRTEIQKDLRRRIENGEWKHGARIPSLEALAEHYGAARGTVRTATNQLAALGMLVAAPGRGIKVIAAPPTHSHLGTFPPADWSDPDSLWGGEETGEISTKAELRQTEIDGIPHIERDYLRTVDGIPVQHKRTTMPLKFAGIIPEGCATPPLLTPSGADVPKPPSGTSPNAWYGWQIKNHYTDITLETVAQDVAESLKIPEGTPVLQQQTKAHQADGTLVYTTTVTVPANGRMTLHQIEQ